MHDVQIKFGIKSMYFGDCSSWHAPYNVKGIPRTSTKPVLRCVLRSGSKSKLNIISISQLNLENV